MAKADNTKVMKASFDSVFDTVTDYAEYPKFVSGCKEVEILSEKESKKKVRYSVNMIKDIEYTLEHKEDRKKGTISWDLIDGDLIKSNSGLWTLTDQEDGTTKVHYSIDIEFSIPVPSLILSRLVKGSLPDMLDHFEKQAKKRDKKASK